MDLSSAQLGRSWGPFGLSWVPLRCLLVSFWVLLDALGRIWALWGAAALDFGGSWAPPGWVLASSGAVFAIIFEGDALIAAGIPAWHSHWHFVTSLQRGGTCAAHGIEVPKNMRFFIDFWLIFVMCCKRQHQKFIGPANVLLAFHTFQFFDFRIHFFSKKPTKNPSKMRPEPFQHRCRK